MGSKAEQLAADWFTINPAYRTKEHLAEKFAKLQERVDIANNMLLAEREVSMRLHNIVVAACKKLESMIAGGEECRGRDAEITQVIRILEGEA